VEAVGTLLPLVLLFLAFYVLIIRPARNRQRTQQRLVSQLEVGTEVMTTAGLYAEIVEVADDTVLLEVAPGVRMRWAKQAVARVVAPTEREAGDETTGAAGERAANDDVDATDEADDPGSPEPRHP
jgi:preprotein translocase subunit YajC